MEKIKSLLPLNFELLGNPVNWIVVILMVSIAGLGLKFILQSTNTVEKE